MRSRKLLIGLVAGVPALAVPAASQAATSAVSMGLPPSPQSKTIQGKFGDANDFFPRALTIHVGDKVKFAPFGFHTVDLVPKGGTELTLFDPTGETISGVNDAAGQPFWFNGEDQIFFNTR